MYTGMFITSIFQEKPRNSERNHSNLTRSRLFKREILRTGKKLFCSEFWFEITKFDSNCIIVFFSTIKNRIGFNIVGAYNVRTSRRHRTLAINGGGRTIWFFHANTRSPIITYRARSFVSTFIERFVFVSRRSPGGKSKKETERK